MTLYHNKIKLEIHGFRTHFTLTVYPPISHTKKLFNKKYKTQNYFI